MPFLLSFIIRFICLNCFHILQLCSKNRFHYLEKQHTAIRTKSKIKPVEINVYFKTILDYDVIEIKHPWDDNVGEIA